MAGRGAALLLKHGSRGSYTFKMYKGRGTNLPGSSFCLILNDKLRFFNEIGSKLPEIGSLKEFTQIKQHKIIYQKKSFTLYKYF